MRFVIFCAVAALLAGFNALSVSAQDSQLYECLAQKRLAGREEPSSESAQSRLPDGQLRYVEKGDPGYASFAPDKPLPDWIGLFGAQNGHASSFLGFYRSKDFRCEKVEG